MRHRALLVYPEYPPSFWSLQFVIDLAGKKALNPPLGLATIAAMFPPRYELRLVDLNVGSLTDSDLEWADVVFTSSMIVQRASLADVIERCNRARVPVVAGGPHPTSFHDEIEGVDHFVLDEVEDTLPGFLADLERGIAKRVYRAPAKPDVTRTPAPRFDLLDLDAYHMMSVQFSRGCPFDCEFCDITKLFGRTPRTKTPEQMLREFDALYRLGWRGNLFIVDDNFIGNQRKAMELLPVLAKWQREHGFPFNLFTEATVNLSRKEKLMDAMIEAGFVYVFLGIETPNPEALRKMKKGQNTSRREDEYLLKAVRRIQHRGLAVTAGFIVGADGDGEEMFDAQIDFIQRAGIPVAMIGLLTALKGTDLYMRLEREGRLRAEDYNGRGDAISLNFEPELEAGRLIAGYRRVLATLYDPTLENYFETCLTMLREVAPNPHLGRSTHFAGDLSHEGVLATWLSAAKLFSRFLHSRKGPAFVRFLAAAARLDLRLLPEAAVLAALGYHFEQVSRQYFAVHDFKADLASELASLRTGVVGGTIETTDVRELLSRAERRSRAIHPDFRPQAEDALASSRAAVAMRSPEELEGVAAR